MQTPTEIHPGLLEERFVILRELIVSARHAAVLRHEVSMGDDNWVLGCRCYRWSCEAIIRAAAVYPEWLAIVEGGTGGLHFVFTIAGVPHRFYRGEPEDISPKTLRCNYPELEAGQAAFAFDAEYRKRPTHLRLAVATDDFGEVVRITLVQVDQDLNPVGVGWVIPEETGKIVQFPKKEEGKDLGKPPVDAQPQPKREEGDDDDTKK